MVGGGIQFLKPKDHNDIEITSGMFATQRESHQPLNIVSGGET